MVNCVIEWGKVVKNSRNKQFNHSEKMFYGEYDYKVDSKGRVAIPPEFRDAFKSGVVLRRAEDKCIDIYPSSAWEDVAQKHVSTGPSRSAIRRKNRYIFSFAFKLNTDHQGRIVIPPPLRQYAQIRDAAVIVGVNTYLELWDKEEWQQEQELLGEEGPQLIERTEEQ